MLTFVIYVTSRFVDAKDSLECIYNENMIFNESLPVVGRISEQFLNNRAFCEESTILTGCVDFYTSMNIRYRGICEINPESQENRISDILI